MNLSPLRDVAQKRRRRCNNVHRGKKEEERKPPLFRSTQIHPESPRILLGPL